MANVANLNLLASTSRVETPFIKVKIGDYTFGVYQKTDEKTTQNKTYSKIIYPNYIKNLNITKINGTVNTYELEMFYQITQNDDPNFFEKVFSSVSKTRKIVFSYGDLSMPYDFSYRDEEAIITKVKTKFNALSSCLTYTISAISSGKILSVGNHTFPYRYEKPSTIIKEILQSNLDGIQDIFYGMRNWSLVEENHLIADDDQKKRIEGKQNISILDYLSYLVNCMVSVGVESDNVDKGPIYVLSVIDDTTIFGGPYIKITKTTKNISYADAYQIDIGYPSQNVVTDFQVEDDETYSIYYDYNETLKQSNYKQVIDDSGNLVQIFAPALTSNTPNHITTDIEKSWWTKVTEYPIKASITLKGLLRPAILMSSIKLNMYYYGRKHISSGIYIVTKEQDTISESGFKTTLSLLRVDTVEIDDFD